MEKAKFLTVDDAAQITGLHPTTILAWERRIRSFKILGALRFKRSDLEELIVERPAKPSESNSDDQVKDGEVSR